MFQFLHFYDKLVFMPEEPHYVYWLHDHTCDDPMKHGYIGLTANVPKREKQHRLKKRFPENFLCKILFESSRAECATTEQKYRPVPDIGWNSRAGGFGGSSPSVATRLKIAAAKIGTTRSAETRAKHSATRMGHIVSPETRAKISAKQKGISKPKWSKELKLRMSTLRKGKKKAPCSNSHKANISAAKKGKPASEATKAALLAAHSWSGRKHSTESKEKMRRTWANKRNFATNTSL